MTFETSGWRGLVAPYARSDTRRAVGQLANTLIPFLALFYLALRSVQVSFWLTLPLTILTAGFMMRTFIIFHDCCHGSFFDSQKANDLLGSLTGILTFTPYFRWKHDHAIHHATAGDLDRRGTGDVYTMTLAEYRAAPWWKQAGYRVMRNPLSLFLVGSLMVFLITQRIPTGAGRRELASVWWTNAALLAIGTALCLTFGWQAYVQVQLLVLFFGASAGIWLFYVQHNFEGVYWARHNQWDFFAASMQGSSFYQLPGILQWFSGNIGFHHIHHLSSRIPNYNLPRAFRENPVFHVQPLTLLSSLRCLKWRLYDEANRRLVGWEGLRQVG
jgi:omega-6 fatty acid desaturase (delta-12 desaturase)